MCWLTWCFNKTYIILYLSTLLEHFSIETMDMNYAACILIKYIILYGYMQWKIQQL